ncbi:PREDICTED: uncharacterized protein LOC107187195 isoform X2 [Dufourea novaeangliae]|uniref:uncharacterized protein LOC107187195 isoform X2 n=1 Tax=Dufourea novaeangliae TaxID=178035 RepID=UPI000766EEB2|nr:PREDICTED: uncharacterized protein LOC107187195 isoform X2 [Dufourea novaeangliae]
MISSSVESGKNTSHGIENTNISPTNMESRSVEELKARVAVRFLVKKSKRFDLLKQQLQRKLQQTRKAYKTEPTPECLLYLGLEPKTVKTLHREEQKHENCTDFPFLKPRVYECGYCTKIFFHKALHRRHMIHHLKKIHWCMKCSRGFTSKISKRRHELACRR